MTSIIARRTLVSAQRSALPGALARPFSASSHIAEGSVTEKAKQSASNLNKSAGQAAAKGIEAAERASETVKQAARTATGQAGDVAGDAKSEFNSVKESAKDMARNARNKSSK